jgi:hypothetical protein
MIHVIYAFPILFGISGLASDDYEMVLKDIQNVSLN